MQKIRLSLLAVVLIFSLVMIGSKPVVAGMESIAVVVNDGVISQSDVNERLKLIMISSGMPNTEELKAQLLPQVVNGLIDEKLKLQEAEKYEISVNDSEINSGLAHIAEQNKLSVEQFKGAMKQSGLDVSTLRSQIKAQVAWSKFVQDRLRQQVVITDSDVDVWMDRMKSSKGKNEYLASEIFLPIDENSDEFKARELARSLVADLRGGKASFFKVAQQVSQAAGAANGGDLGWVQQGQLPKELDEVLMKIEAGQITDPIRSVAGYHIMLVRERRQVTEENMPEVQDIRNMIGFQRLNRLQERYMMDLKSSAFIENRLEQQS
ncbi:MAG: peptidylprolyl isomerase [Micavibrio sp.]|nr:peptidylprolyl isomerase [Micavibrio sp.]